MTIDSVGGHRLKAAMVAVFLLTAVFAAKAATPLTVEQLRSFLASPWARKAKDSAMADRLGSFELNEQLTEGTLAQFLENPATGPQTREQLSLLAAASLLHDPPKTETPELAAPDPAEQKRWIDAVIAFANGYLQHLPDFLATRRTQSFDNAPQTRERRHAAPRIALHWVGEARREVAYRDGNEVVDEGPLEGSASHALTLKSWGEFGAVLRTAVSDAFAGSVQFKRWDTQTFSRPVAVLHFAVPRAVSHYLVDFCCYQSYENAGWMEFRDTPGYHGDIYFDPRAGQIVRLRLEAELQPGAEVSTSGIIVDYQPVSIGGRDYDCPVRSVAILIAHSVGKAKIDGDGRVTHLNITSFQDYRKFGSSARILPAQN